MYSIAVLALPMSTRVASGDTVRSEAVAQMAKGADVLVDGALYSATLPIQRHARLVARTRRLGAFSKKKWRRPEQAGHTRINGYSEVLSGNDEPIRDWDIATKHACSAVEAAA
jgi:hypothetical protein